MPGYKELARSIPLREGDLVRVLTVENLAGTDTRPGQYAVVMEHKRMGVQPFTGTVHSSRVGGSVYVREADTLEDSIPPRTATFTDRGWQFARNTLELVIPEDVLVTDPQIGGIKYLRTDVCTRADCESDVCIAFHEDNFERFLRAVRPSRGATNLPLLEENAARAFIQTQQMLHPHGEGEGKPHHEVMEFFHLDKEALSTLKKKEIIARAELAMRAFVDRLHRQAERRSWCTEYEEVLSYIREAMPEGFIVDPRLGDGSHPEAVTTEHDVTITGVIPFEKTFKIRTRVKPDHYMALLSVEQRIAPRLRTLIDPEHYFQAGENVIVSGIDIKEVKK